MRILPHNKEAYKKVKEAFKTSKKTCVVQPTGTGKSYIALQLIRDCKADKKILFVTSYDSVRNKFVELLNEYAPAKNVDCQVYMGLLNKELGNYNIIILDEFHRVGAEKWGKAVSNIIASSPNAYVLGLSATPIRYTDNKRDMSDELFKGNVASEMTLAQAIARGILPLPKYVTCIYSMQEEYTNALAKVDKIKSAKRRDRAMHLLERAKRYLEKSNGLSDVFNEYIENKSGRYLVFCKNREHMIEMLEESKDWFKTVNFKVNRYSIDSTMSCNAVRNIERDFENDTSDALKLLFCINMYNEGYHFDSLDGVILLRPTDSINIYLQQIGRALSAGGGTPLIIDVVRNISCLNHCELLKEEVNTLLGEASEFNKEFKIYAYMQEFLDSLDEFYRFMQPDWWTMYNVSKEFIDMYGSDVLIRHTRYKSHLIGAWLYKQYQAVEVGSLSSDKATAVELLGLSFTDLDTQWNINFERYKKLFGSEEGRRRFLLTKTSEYLDESFRNWISLQRFTLPKHLTNLKYLKRYQLLDSVNFVWDYYKEVWELKCKILKQYIDTTGDYKISKLRNKERYQGVDLGTFISRCRSEIRDGILSVERQSELYKTGVVIDRELDVVWLDKYKELRSLIESRQVAVTEENIKVPPALSSWMSMQRKALAQHKLSVKQERLINELEELKSVTSGWWESYHKYRILIQQDWAFLSADLKHFLSHWGRLQRVAYNSNKLTDWQINSLRIIEFDFNDCERGVSSTSNTWKIKLEEFIRYIADRSYSSSITEFFKDAPELKTWLSSQRHLLLIGKLSESRLKSMCKLYIRGCEYHVLDIRFQKNGLTIWNKMFDQYRLLTIGYNVSESIEAIKKWRRQQDLILQYPDLFPYRCEKLKGVDLNYFEDVKNEK